MLSRPLSFYGIKDPCYQGDCETPVLKRELFDSGSVVVFKGGEVSGAGRDVDNWTGLLKAVNSERGWYLDLAAEKNSPGERVLFKPAILDGIALFTTFTPNSEICSCGGNGNLYALYFETGTAYKESVIGMEEKEILKSINLGSSLPSSPGIHLGKEESGAAGYIHLSHGTIKQINLNLGPGMKSGMISWRETR